MIVGSVARGLRDIERFLAARGGRFLSDVEVDLWLKEPAEEKCPGCDCKMLRFETFNGMCDTCRIDAFGNPPGSCSCPGSVGHGGYHYNHAKEIVERCPAYWRAAGYLVIPDTEMPLRGRLMKTREER